MHHRIRAQRHNIFFGQRLDAVGNRLKNPKRTHAIRAVAILHAPQPLALQQHRQRKQRGKQADNDMRRSDITPTASLPSARQKSHEPVLMKNEYLVELVDHAFGSPSFGVAAGAAAGLAGVAPAAAAFAAAALAAAASAAAFAFASALAFSSASRASTSAASVG